MSLLVTAENFNEISIEFFNNFEILMKFYCSLSWKVHRTSLAARKT